MTRHLSIAVVGNCQARPLAQTLLALVPHGRISTVAIVHLLRDAQEAEHAPQLAASDVIFAQSVADNYPCRFVRCSELRRKYGRRVVTWPNLYYAGYNPELTYLRQADRKPLGGPLGDYHNRLVLDAWRQGLGVGGARQRLHDLDHSARAYGDVPQRSLDELRRRELATDVRIVDAITERLWEHRLFFVFNHPAQALITLLARQLLQVAGIVPSGTDPRPNDAREPLGQYRCPVNRWVAQALNCRFDESPAFHGVAVESGPDGAVTAGPRRIYSEQEVVETFFRVYDHSRDRLQSLRETATTAP